MPKAVTPGVIIAALERQGFIRKRTKGSHYIFQHPATKRRVVVPLHKKDLPKGTLHSIFKQAGFSIDDL